MSTVQWFGETFTLNPSVSADAMSEFAEAASGASADAPQSSMAAAVKVRALVWDCIVPADLDRFKAVSKKNRASTDDWMVVLSATVEQETERPTGRPSDSPDGPSNTGPKSVSSSAGKDSGRFVGRPDLQLAVQRMRSA